MNYIFDLDHTVVDSSHRQATRPDGSLDLDHWREHSTPAMIERDTLLPLAHEWRKIQRMATPRLSFALLASWVRLTIFTSARVVCLLRKLSAVVKVTARRMIC